MTQREFVQGGLKLIGFWLLATGVVNLASSISVGTSVFVVLRNNPSTSHIGIFSTGFRGGPETTPEQITEQSRLAVQWSQAQTQFLWALLQALFALYLCRRGGAVVRFLIGKEEERAESGARGPTQ